MPAARYRHCLTVNPAEYEQTWACVNERDTSPSHYLAQSIRLYNETIGRGFNPFTAQLLVSDSANESYPDLDKRVDQPCDRTERLVAKLPYGLVEATKVIAKNRETDFAEHTRRALRLGNFITAYASRHIEFLHNDTKVIFLI